MPLASMCLYMDQKRLLREKGKRWRGCKSREVGVGTEGEKEKNWKERVQFNCASVSRKKHTHPPPPKEAWERQKEMAMKGVYSGDWRCVSEALLKKKKARFRRFARASWTLAWGLLFFFLVLFRPTYYVWIRSPLFKTTGQCLAVLLCSTKERRA